MTKLRKFSTHYRGIISYIANTELHVACVKSESMCSETYRTRGHPCLELHKKQN